jgi:hypothetical protein
MCPTPLLISDEIIRIFYAALDKNSIGRIGYIDVAAQNPRKIIFSCSDPILNIGAPGHFDDNGVVPISLVERDKRIYLYYAGFQLSTKVRYLIFSGLAISDNQGINFERYSSVPILDRKPEGSIVRSAPCVLHDDDGGYHLWYIAGSNQINIGGKDIPTYQVRYAHSDDGISWPTEGRIVINFENDDEYGFGRPHVIRGSSGYHMWYSVRSKSTPYRIGYAFSKNGCDWNRFDELTGLTTSQKGWDSDMVYANSVCITKYDTYMFYNGNDYGKLGFGFASLNGKL